MVELHALMLFVVAALGIFAPAVPITLHRDEPQMQGQADVQAALIGAAFGGPAPSYDSYAAAKSVHQMQVA